MGEVADMMLDGTLCSACGGELDGESPGFPRWCELCESRVNRTAHESNPRRGRRGRRNVKKNRR